MDFDVHGFGEDLEEEELFATNVNTLLCTKQKRWFGSFKITSHHQTNRSMLSCKVERYLLTNKQIHPSHNIDLCVTVDLK